MSLELSVNEIRTRENCSSPPCALASINFQQAPLPLNIRHGLVPQLEQTALIIFEPSWNSSHAREDSLSVISSCPMTCTVWFQDALLISGRRRCYSCIIFTVLFSVVCRVARSLFYTRKADAPIIAAQLCRNTTKPPKKSVHTL